jgi:mannose-P-dolichol utilization defect protein 1
MLDCMDLLKKGQLYQECFKIYISKILGFAIVFLSAILKVPQIRSILREQSIEGLTSISVYSDLIVVYFGSLYGYHQGIPFSTYGENVIISVQCFIILFLYWRYSQSYTSPLLKIGRVLVILCFIGFAAVCCHDGGSLLPEKAWTIMSSSTVPILSAGRLSIIYNSLMTKSTGTLSMFNYVLNVGGNLTRFFTLFTETKEYMLMFTQLYCFVVNSVIVLLIVLFGGKKKKIEGKTE